MSEPHEAPVRSQQAEQSALKKVRTLELLGSTTRRAASRSPVLVVLVTPANSEPPDRV